MNTLTYAFLGDFNSEKTSLLKNANGTATDATNEEPVVGNLPYTLNNDQVKIWDLGDKTLNTPLTQSLLNSDSISAVLLAINAKDDDRLRENVEFLKTHQHLFKEKACQLVFTRVVGDFSAESIHRNICQQLGLTHQNTAYHVITAESQDQGIHTLLQRLTPKVNTTNPARTGGSKDEVFELVDNGTASPAQSASPQNQSTGTARPNAQTSDAHARGYPHVANNEAALFAGLCKALCCCCCNGGGKKEKQQTTSTATRNEQQAPNANQQPML